MLVVLVDDVDVVGATVVVVPTTVVGSSAIEVRTGGTDVEPAVAASESEPVVADASATMAMPTTPTIMTRLATSSILAGLQPRTTAPLRPRSAVTERRRIRSSLMAERPTITIPDSDPPADLLIEDETIGDGEEAVVGKRVYVHYAGVAWSSGDEFDASWNRGDVFDFRLGAREVIEGWDKGVAGMRVGGRRRLTIPPHLGYGSRGAGGVIKGGETLVFVVDLVNVR